MKINLALDKELITFLSEYVKLLVKVFLFVNLTVEISFEYRLPNRHADGLGMAPPMRLRLLAAAI